jgi:hypothetical protein
MGGSHRVSNGMVTDRKFILMVPIKISGIAVPIKYFLI